MQRYRTLSVEEIHICLYVGMHVSQYICGGQRETFANHFSSTMWVLRIKLSHHLGGKPFYPLSDPAEFFCYYFETGPPLAWNLRSRLYQLPEISGISLAAMSAALQLQLMTSSSFSYVSLGSSLFPYSCYASRLGNELCH